MYTWISLNSNADLSQLKAKIPAEYDPDRVIAKLTDGLSDAVKAILIEEGYIDKDYRSTYYNFYVKKGLNYRPDCVRLHFFNQLVSFEENGLKLNCPDRLKDHYFGYMVLRPTGFATIGRTVLSPNIRKGVKGLSITAEHSVSLLGYNLSIQGMPSMDQHSDISVCAHSACWSILRHFSESNNIYPEFLTYDITLMAHEFNPGGLVPSKGLAVSHAERVFQEAGTFPFYVARKENGDDPAYYRQLQAYVESGFPLFAAMHERGHAIAITGYEWKSSPTDGAGIHYAWDEVKSLVVIDDNYLPYYSVPVTSDDPDKYSAQDIDAFIVPLPEKIFYPADAVDKLAPNLYKQQLIELPPKEETIIRYFIATGSRFRSFIREQSGLDPKLVEAVMKLPFAQYLWIVEFATKTEWQTNKISARAVIDATASIHEAVPLWLFHNKTNALVFNRQKIGYTPENIAEFALSNLEGSSLIRMDNLDRIKNTA